MYLRTWNFLSLAACFRNFSTVLERPSVRMTSFVWMCSSACFAISSVPVSISMSSSSTLSMTRDLSPGNTAEKSTAEEWSDEDLLLSTAS